MEELLFDVMYGLSEDMPEEKNEGVLYFVTDTKQIFRGDVEYTGNVKDVTLEGDVNAEKVGTYRMTISFKDNTTAIVATLLNTYAVDNIVRVLNGTGNAVNKGLVKLSDSIESESNSGEGVAATPKAVYEALGEAKYYTDERINSTIAEVLNGVIYKSAVGTAALPNLPTSYKRGHMFKVAVAGDYLGTGSILEVGDMIIANKNNETDHVLAEDWDVIQGNLDGVVLAGEALPEDQLLVGAGGNSVKYLKNGVAGYVLTMVNGKPEWRALQTSDIKVKQTPMQVTLGEYNLLMKNSANDEEETNSVNFKPTLKYDVGTETLSANAKSASKLKVGRTIHVDLEKSESGSFDGSTDVSIGVDGVLPIDKGGTGAITPVDARSNLGLGAAAIRDVAKKVEETAGLIEARAVYEALRWKNFAELNN